MTEAAHTHDWTPEPTLNTDAVQLIQAADTLEHRTRKPTEFIPLAQKIDQATWEQLKAMARGGIGEPA